MTAINANPAAARPREDERARGAVRARVTSTRNRQAIEQTVELARHLSRADAATVKSLLEGTMRPADLAKLAGQPPWRIRRRFRRLIRRLTSPNVHFIVSQMELWPDRRREVATRVHLRGESQQRAADAMGLSRYVVRRELDAINVLIDQARTMRRLR